VKKHQEGREISMTIYLTKNCNSVDITISTNIRGKSVLRCSDHAGNVIDQRDRDEVVDLINSRNINGSFLEESYLFFLEKERILV